MRKLTFLAFLLLAQGTALAGGPGPAPFNAQGCYVYDDMSDPYSPNHLTIDASGGMLVKLEAGGSTADVNLAKVNGATTQAGNGTTGTGTLRVTVSSDSTGQISAIQGTAASLANAWTAKITDGTNMATVKAASTAAAAIDPALVVSLSPNSPLGAGSATIGAVTQAGTWETGDAQASTTSGQLGPLVQGATTTSAPTYTTAKTNPLSLTTAGGLRGDMSSVNGVTTATGSGVMGTGVQRVAIASDNDAVTVKQATGTNLHAVLDTTSTTTVTQATASNLNADVNLKTVNAVTVLTGTGAVGTGSQRIAVGTDTATIAGSAPGTAGSPSTNVVSIQGVTSGTTVPVTASLPTTASILDGRQTFTSTTGATTLITVTAGKTWVGTIGASVDCNTAAASATACKANATFTTVGAGTTPAAGTYFACQAGSGANSATGTVGSQGANYCASSDFVVNCASGTCTIAVATTQAGTASLVEAFAHGTQN